MTDNTKKPTLKDMHRLGEEFRNRLNLESSCRSDFQITAESLEKLADRNQNGTLDPDEQLAVIDGAIKHHASHISEGIIPAGLQKFKVADAGAIKESLAREFRLNVIDLPSAYLEVIQQAATVVAKPNLPGAVWNRLPNKEASRRM